MMGMRHAPGFIILIMVLQIFGIPGCTHKHDTDVEFVPTPQPVIMEMLKMAGVAKNDVVYDLGCGDGRIVITAAKMFGARGVGVDVDPVLLRNGNEKSRKAGVSDRVQFVKDDLFQTDLSKATVVTLYLTPELNLRLRPKLFRELKPGARVLAHDFNMGAWKPDDMGRLRNITYEYPDKTYKRDAHFYAWVIPADASGTWRWTLVGSAVKKVYSLRLFQRFQEISGVATSEGRESPITDARLSGAQLSFTFSDEAEGRQAVMWFSGRVSGSAIDGVLEVQGGENAGNYPWTAKRDP